MKPVLLLAMLFILIGCADPGSVYVGFLDNHDQEIFRDALRIEHVDDADEEALLEPWTWLVVYGSPLDTNGVTIPVILGRNAIFIRRGSQRSVSDDCPQDRLRFVTYRHEIGHTQGKRHVAEPKKVMHNPAPCYPTD